MEISQSNKSAVVVGATGMIGKLLVDQLYHSGAYTSVRVLARKPQPSGYSDKLDWVVDPLTDHHDYDPLVQGDDLFIALGTTMAKAGSKEAFRRVDFELAFNMAKAAALNGAKQCLLVSSVGADKDSLFFYNRVKGELEDAILSLPFWATHIFRPSILLGDRGESRPLEFIGQKISSGVDRLAGNLFGAYRPVKGDKVAAAMVYWAQQLEGGHFFHPSDEIATFDASQNLPIL